LGAELAEVAPEQQDDRRWTPGDAPSTELVRSGVVEPRTVVSQLEDVGDAIEAYEGFDAQRPGRLKVDLEPVG
jgi:threonine dehydrogenase-like Zn-dependent dehydrogenase